MAIEIEHHMNIKEEQSSATDIIVAIRTIALTELIANAPKVDHEDRDIDAMLSRLSKVK